MSRFVGRVDELSELRAGLDQALAGRTRLFTLVGEAGIGKTRIASEASTIARERGITTTWVGCCDGVGAPPYWPFIQTVRKLRTDLGSPGAPSLSGLLSIDVPSHEDTLDLEQQHDDADASRFRLFDRTATLLSAEARRNPLLLVFDDFHEADDASWLLLRFIVKEIREAALMLVVIFREPENSSAQLEISGDFYRIGRRLQVSGLDQSEIQELLSDSLGHAEPNLAAALHRRTGGNPFFLTEIVDAMRAAGDSRDEKQVVPVPVRVSIQSRLRALPKPTRTILSRVAIIGTQFDVGLASCLVNETPERLHEIVDTAVRVGVLKPVSSGQYTFVHALVREAIYAELQPELRAQTHREIAEILEQMYSGNPEQHLDELAYHFVAGASQSNRGKAVDYASRAGEAASVTFAYERAASHWQSALQLLEGQHADPRQLAELLQKLGEAYAITEFDQPKALAHLRRAAELLEQIDDREAAARVRATLGMLLSRRAATMNIDDAMDEYQRAEEVLRQQPASEGQGLLYIGIAQAATQAERTREGSAASARAMRIAQDLENEALWVLAAAHHSDFLFSSGKLSASFDLVERAWRIADRLDDLGSAFEAAWSGGYHPLGLWDPRSAQKWFRRELSRPRLANASYQSSILKQQMAFAYVLLGQLRKARELLAEAPRAVVEAMLKMYEGDWQTADRILDEGCEAMVSVGSRNGETIAAFFRGQVRFAMNDLPGAEAANARVVRNSIEGPILPYELNSRAQAALIAIRARHLEQARPHVDRCREILDLGEDFRGLAARAVLAQAAFNGALGNIDTANALFSQAIGEFSRYDLKWEEAAAFCFWGEALKSNRLLTEAVQRFAHSNQIYTSCHAGQGWLDYVETGRRDCMLTSAAPEAPSQVANVFRSEGNFWLVTYRGDSLRLKDSRGMHHISLLLENPDKKIAVEDLIRYAGLSQHNHSDEKPRRRDRQRIAVTKSIKWAIENIRRANPGLGRMLATAIKTGYTCSYQTDPDQPIYWQVGSSTGAPSAISRS